MTSLLFGANCSPFIAQHIKNKNATRFKDELPEATDAILKSHYMDDYIESLDNIETARKMIKSVSYIHHQGGFEIRNWISNKQEVLTNMPQETLSDKAIKIKSACDELPERTLGLLWYPASDSFGFDLSLKRVPTDILKLQRKPTKRELLRIFMSIFDVFGFLAPFTVKAKIMLQNTWKCNINWDDEISDNENKTFQDWILELNLLQHLRVPRYHFANPKAREQDNASSNSDCQNETTLELHVFCDASPAAYAAVAYYRQILAHTQMHISFIACKSRAAPINKCITIPKLEMQAAVIACRLADTIARESRLVINKRFFWTDSQIVLCQIMNNTRNYKVFIANRLGEIDELSQPHEWNYIPTKLNIADKATKINTYKLSNDGEWLRGPHFLHLPREDWPLMNPEKIEKYDDEMLQVNFITNNYDNYVPVPEPTRFSSWLRLCRCMANVLLFIEKCRTAGTAELTSEIMQHAENHLLRYSQLQSFPEEVNLIKNSKPISNVSRLRKLTPVCNENGLLSVGGRIEAAANVNPSVKRPIILDGRDYISKLIVGHYHKMAAHSCTETVVNELRQKYWLLKLRPTVRTIAAKCVYCRIRKARATSPRMGDLPEARLAHHQRPYTYCGVDLFGPMEITVGRRRDKRYGVLFTCLTVRAIHIELVPSLSTDSFIMALRRMAARRGWPYRMYSDNGTNFRGADSELKRSFKEINEEAAVKNELTNRGLEWHFISPASPHMGGAWERLISSVKTALRVILKERAPREEVLITLLAEVENIVNSRPLSHVSVDPEYPESLTPNHFLIGTSSNLPVPGKFDNDDFYSRKLWRITERLADMFWQRWVREVLPTMLPRQKWFQEGHQLKQGDVVVIVDPKLPRNTWPKGIIESVHPGADGRVRIVDIRTKTGILTRPVTRVALLPTAAENDCPERTMGGRMM